MTQASVTRISKKKKDKPLATTSFAQAMGNAQLNALKPYIDEQIAFASQQISQTTYQIVLQERAAMQTRQLAFERMLKANTTWFTQELLAMEVANVEDEAQGLVATEGPALMGDKVRIDFSALPSGAEANWTDTAKLCIHQIMVKGRNGAFQTHEEVEGAIVGRSVGETFELLVAEPAEEGKEPEHTRCKVTVKKISRPKAPEAK